MDQFDQSKRPKGLFGSSAGGGGGGGEGAEEFDKNILLIIDPQNDFSDVRDPYRAEPGKLAVPGASDDYQRIIQFICEHKDSLNEIHVSLDTHTSRHIGHPGFWDVIDDNGVQSHATDDVGFSILSIDKDNKISGFNIIDKKNRTFVPRRYDADSYPALCEYVHEYLHFFDKDEQGNFLPGNKHTQLAWIWKDHCLEETEGHKIASELQVALDDFASVSGKIVRYHIKGQNNLAEMFSIFSAEKPVPPAKYETLKSYMYTGLEAGHGYDHKGAASYAGSVNSLNIETGLNTGLMDLLLGRNNRLFICGEAKTHCVKSSTVDLLEYAEAKEVSGPRIVLLANMSSCIPGVPDDIEDITCRKGYSVHRE